MMSLNMTKADIYREYKQAKNPKLQIGILADENGVEPDVIRAIVKKMAAAETDKPAHENEPDCYQIGRIIELYNKGKTYRQIAEMLSITLATVQNRIRRLLNDGVLNYRRLPEKEKAPKPVAADKDAHKKLSSNVIIHQ